MEEDVEGGEMSVVDNCDQSATVMDGSNIASGRLWGNDNTTVRVSDLGFGPLFFI